MSCSSPLGSWQWYVNGRLVEQVKLGDLNVTTHRRDGNTAMTISTVQVVHNIFMGAAGIIRPLTSL